MIHIIAAVARNNVIGFQGHIPWDYPEDRAYFRKVTTNHIVVMGRCTYEAIGKALPDRLNIIVSQSKDFSGQNLHTEKDLRDAVAFAESSGFSTEIFLCGGQEIYTQGIKITDRIYLTAIDADYPGDRFFPAFPQNQFQLMHHTKGNTPELTFSVYERI